MDAETVARAKRGERPDLIGWGAIAIELGVHRETARKWARLNAMPVVAWGPTQVGAYSDRLRVWAAGHSPKVA